MPRVLVLYASVGTGHKRAAEALAAAFEQLWSAVTVQVEDVLDHTSKLFRMAYARSYLQLTGHAPLAWGYFYSQTNVDPELAEVTNTIRKLVEGIGVNGLKEVLKWFQPDVIICTHFLPMELLVRLKRSARLRQPVYCIITDFVAHTFWTYTEIDGYFVADQQTRCQLIQRGVAPARIIVSGIPIDPAIALAKDRAAIRTRLNVSTSDMLVTLFGGGVADERVRLIIEGLLHNGTAGTLIVVAGRNPTLSAALAHIQSSPTMKVLSLGHINFVDDLMATSDLVITKAGGLIVSEALARGTPLVIIDPILGHEEWNADFVVSHGAGIQLRMVESVPTAVYRLLHNDSLLADMRVNAMTVGQPQAAVTIAEAILRYADRIV